MLIFIAVIFQFHRICLPHIWTAFAAEGYTVIPLIHLIAYFMQGDPLPPNPVVLTFDDGYRDNYENAFPLLQARNIPATFFLVMEFINRERPEYLTWAMVDEMAAAGMTLRPMGSITRPYVIRQRPTWTFRRYVAMKRSKIVLVYAHTLSPILLVNMISRRLMPFSEPVNWAGLTTVQGATHRGDALFRLQRVRVRGSTTPDELARLTHLGLVIADSESMGIVFGRMYVTPLVLIRLRPSESLLLALET